MQRTILRWLPVTVDSALVPVSGRAKCRPAAGWTLLIATACLLLGRLSLAAEPDNVLLDFTATWCGPCQAMSSIVSRLERQGYPIRKVDVDKEPGLAAKYRVQSIPCFVLVANGKELDRVTGGTSENQLRGMLNRLPKQQAAREIPESRRDDNRQASLGTAIPVTPESNDARPPRKSFPNFFASDTEQQPPPVDDERKIVRGQSAEVNPMRSSVRLRVKDGTAINFGSGSLIDSQAGQATIVTCAHIFRRMSKGAVVEVDLFTGPAGKPETVTGRVLLTDADADVGLVTISYPKRLPVVPLGPSGMPLAVGDRLFSIGCSGGDNPTREEMELTQINKYDGPDNLECTTRPQQGRSGGGLFRDDELVGICVLADPKHPRGIYAGLQPVGLLLEKAGLTHLLPRQPGNLPLAKEAGPAQQQQQQEEPVVPRQPVKIADVGDDVNTLLAGALGGDAPATPQDLAGAEIICIVRSRTPGKPSRVVIVNQASGRFVADLLQESQGDMGRTAADPDRGQHAIDERPVETSFESKPGRRPNAR